MTAPIRATVEHLGRLNDAPDLLTAATIYVGDLGLNVFPLQPNGKKPLTDNGFHDASGDIATIHGWWHRWPNANIGWPVPVGVAVLDVDDLDSAVNVESAHGQLGSPLAFRTGRGVQLVYRVTTEIRNSAGVLAPGFDVRGSGGYSVMPPSRHPNGETYTWLALQPDMTGMLEPAPMPAWMTAHLTRRPSPGPISSVPGPPSSNEAFGEGRRNAGLTTIAGSLRRHGCDEATILAALESANQRQCSPPLDDREVERIAASVSRYDPAGMPMRLPSGFQPIRGRRAS